MTFDGNKTGRNAPVSESGPAAPSFSAGHLLASARRPGVREVSIGPVTLGGRAPVSIQSMTNTSTEDPDSTLDQIRRLARKGCEIVRLAVPTREAARRLRRIVRESPVPVVADIHFNHRLALMAVDAGVAALRLNPGNIGASRHVAEVARAASAAGIPIRIGVNGGSIEKDLEERFGNGPKALVESALRHIRILEDLAFHDIIVSIKSSSVRTTLASYRMIAGLRPYPLHVGVTEAGAGAEGLVKSILGIGMLLVEGIGETIRVSLTGNPESEIPVARKILETASGQASVGTTGDNR